MPGPLLELLRYFEIYNSQYIKILCIYTLQVYFLFLTLPDESQISSKGQIWSAMRLNGKAVTKSLNGKNLQQMIKLKEDLRF